MSDHHIPGNYCHAMDCYCPKPKREIDWGIILYWVMWVAIGLALGLAL